jgi:hypothetical protein
MSRVIAYRTKANKYNYVVIGDDVQQSTLAVANQGYERKAGVENGREALLKALLDASSHGTEYMSRTEYAAFLRQRRKLRK